MTRKDILSAAEECVCTSRQEEYGPVEDNFYKISKLWNAYLGDNVTDSHDVAIMMALLKIARMATGTFKGDSYVDACGYLACAGELALRKNE